MDLTSKFRPVCFGIAAENLTFGSKVLEVTPVEWLPYLDGELNADAVEVTDKGVDGFGQHYTAKVPTTNSIRATWLPWGSNRATAPNIRRGERLMLYQFADSDQYYWKELGLDDGLRRLETVVYVFSNTRDESVKTLTPDNAYSIEVSTHTKQITLRTNKSDGEPFAYTFQFNTKDGVVTLADDDENYLEFDSAERKITAKNKDGSFITIDKRQIKAFAPDTISMKSEAIEAVCTTFDLQATASIDMQTTTWTVVAETLQGNIAATTLTGTLLVQGLATFAGGMAAVPGTGGATAAISVPMTSTQSITVTGADVIADGIGLKAHKHTEQGDGAPTSSAIP